MRTARPLRIVHRVKVGYIVGVYDATTTVGVYDATTTVQKPSVQINVTTHGLLSRIPWRVTKAFHELSWKENVITLGKSAVLKETSFWRGVLLSGVRLRARVYGQIETR